MNHINTNPNLLLCDLLQLEAEYYRQCEKDGIDVVEEAKIARRFFTFLRDNNKKLATIMRKRLNSHKKSYNYIKKNND